MSHLLNNQIFLKEAKSKVKISEKEEYFLKEIFQYFLNKKEIFYLKPTSFFRFIEKQFIENIKSDKLKTFVFKFLIYFRSLIKIKNTNILYHEFSIFFYTIFYKINKNLIFCKTSKNFEDKNSEFKKLLNNNSISPFIVIKKIDKSLYSGFQIYTNKNRIEYSYQRIFIDLFNKIEKNTWEQENE